MFSCVFNLQFSGFWMLFKALIVDCAVFCYVYIEVINGTESSQHVVWWSVKQKKQMAKRTKKHFSPVMVTLLLQISKFKKIKHAGMKTFCILFNQPQPNIIITLLSKIFQNLSFIIGLSEGWRIEITSFFTFSFLKAIT